MKHTMFEVYWEYEFAEAHRPKIQSMIEAARKGETRTVEYNVFELTYSSDGVLIKDITNPAAGTQQMSISAFENDLHAARERIRKD